LTKSVKASRWTSYRAVLRRRPFLLFFGGSVVSTLGNHFFELALMWLTFSETRSSLKVAAIAVVFQVTYVVVGPAAGVFADRWDRRRTMIVCDLIRSGLLGGFIFATFRFGFSFPLALLAVFLLESTGRFFGPSRQAYIPTLVERDQLVTANGLLTGIRQAAGLGGQALAGVVIATAGALAAMVIDAVSFVFSAVSLMLIRPGDAPKPESPVQAPEMSRARRFWSELREGYRVLAGVPVLRALLLFAIFENAIFAMIEPAMPAYVRTDLHTGAWAYGLVGSFQFAGGLFGGLLAGGLASKLRAGTLIVATTAFNGGAVIAAGLVHVVPGALMLWGAWGFSLAVMGVVEQSLEQALLPSRLLARVLAMMSSVGMVLMPTGSLLGGFLANRIGAAPLYVLVGAGFVAASGAILAHPILRSARLDTEPEEVGARP
jgi:hypothetical protein